MNLYVTGGDGASFNWVDWGQGGAALNRCVDPLNEGGALRSQDLRTSGDPVTLDGAVLRLDPDTGAGLPGSPFAGRRTQIIAYGLRNPFRARPARPKELWIGDVGWDTREEINRVPADTDSVIENFGWPCYEGRRVSPATTTGTWPSARRSTPAAAPSPRRTPATATATRWSQAILSARGLVDFRYSLRILRRRPLSGRVRQRNVLRGLLAQMHLGHVRGRHRTPSTSNLKDFVDGAEGPSTCRLDPAATCITSISVAERFAGSSPRRQRSATGRGDHGVVHERGVAMTVKFDGTGSSDPNGDALSFAWDLDADGAFDD